MKETERTRIENRFICMPCGKTIDKIEKGYLVY
jgi:hypothetical protein